MAYENIRIDEPIFCIGPQAGGYYTLFNIGTGYIVYVKNNNGLIIDTYTLDPSTSLDYEVPNAIKDFIYVGPINQANTANDLIFYTLESIEYIDCENCGTPLRVALIGPPLYQLNSCPTCGQSIHYASPINELRYFKCFIKKWLMNDDLKVLILHSTIEKISDSTYNYEASGLVIETLETTLSTPIEPSYGYINLTTVSGIEKYDTIMVGPSTHTYSFDGVESCSVHSVSVPKVEVTTIEGYIPTKNYYMADDGVIIIKNLYLVCKCKYVAEETDPNTFIFHRLDDGFLYKLDLNNYGALIEVDRNNLYNYTEAVIWDLNNKTINLVCDTQLLFIDPYYNYTCIKSMQLFNRYDGNTLPIYDMDVVGNTLYMLQMGITKRDDEGNYLYFPWTTYNYAIESLLPVTHSIAIVIDDYNLTQNQLVNIRAIVKDQFGAALIYKNIVFYKEKALGLFDPLDGVGITNGDGIVDITFHLISPTVNEELEITVRVDGGGTYFGSNYIWNSVVLFIEYDITNSNLFYLTPYYSEYSNIEEWWPQYSEGTIYLLEDTKEVNGTIYTRKVESTTHYFFKYLLYHHDLGNSIKSPPPPRPAPNFASGDLFLVEVENKGGCYLEAPIDDNGCPVDILYVSRHFNSDINKLSLDIYQFNFVSEAHPTFWSEKNTINTYIWLRLRPFAFDLISDTLKFRMKEVSYAGDTGWMDITNELIVTTFPAGGGLYGLDIMWTNNFIFHNGGTVYVWIEVYDAASPPNKIEIQYWFKIVPDYLRPYITNEKPAREENNVNLDTSISFDIMDIGSGIDINTIEVFIKSRKVRNLVITMMDNDVHVLFQPELVFLYSDVVGITVYASDMVGNSMVDKWLFYCAGSIPPWFNEGDRAPIPCSEGLYRFYSDISTQVYAAGDGVDLNSIEFTVGEVNRRSKITPIIYRIE